MKRKERKSGKKKNRLWTEALAYLRESKKFVYFAILLFVFGGVIGFLFPEVFAQYFDEIIKELIGKIEGLNATEMIFFIFQNNVLSAFLAVVLGFVFGIFPFVSIVVNGTLLGYVMNRAIAVDGVFTVWRLLPHGIFELPAIFIAVGLGIRLGMFWFVGKGEKSEEFRKRFWGGLKVFLMIILPLLIVAAIIEGVLIGLG